MMLKPKNTLFRFISNFLFWIFRHKFFRTQNIIFSAILHARGYNNHSNNIASGESFFIEKILLPTNPKICIDIGANIGDYSQEILEKTSATVIAFEPLQTQYNYLKSRLQVFGNRAITVNEGVSNISGHMDINYHPERSEHASFSTSINKIDYVNNEFKQKSKTTTLDDWINQHKISRVDFIKIDVEGFEKEVLIGASKTILSFKPKFIQIEFNWHQLFRDTTLFYFSEILSNYYVYQLLHNNWIKRDPKDPFSNIYLYSNFVFVHK